MTQESRGEKEYRAGRDGLTRLISAAQADFSRKRRTTETANAPAIEFLERKRRLLLKRWVHCSEEVAALPFEPPNMRQRSIWLVLGILLTAVTFGMAEITVAPFGWGIAGHLFCLGIAAAAPLSAHLFLVHFPQRMVLKALVAVAFVSSVWTMLPLADIRSGQLQRLLDGDNGLIILDRVETAPVEDRSAKRDVEFIRVAMILGTLAIELSAAIAWSRFADAAKPSGFTRLKQLEKQLLSIEKQLRDVMVRLQELRSEAVEAYETSWNMFERGLTEGMSQVALLKRASILVGAALIGALKVEASTALDLIVAIDFTQTESQTGPGGKSEFQENRAAVARMLSAVPAGTHLTVVAVTDRTFVTPHILLEARLSGDEGYRGTSLAAARRGLISEWERRTATAAPTFPHTDVLGVFQFAAERFQSSLANRVLIILSDVRDDIELDLERPARIGVEQTLRYVEKNGLVPRLDGVRIFIAGAGAHNGSRDNAYMLGLLRFWTEFCKRTGGDLRMFSTTRDLDRLREAVSLVGGDRKPR